MIDPREVENIKFKTTRVREGYDQDEVDGFLDRVALTLRTVLDSNSNLEAECGRLRARNDVLQRALDARDEAKTIPVPVVMQHQVQQEVQQTPGVVASRLLDMAQKTADDMTAQAAADALSCVEQANRTADEIIGRATTEADARRAAAEESAKVEEAKLAAIAEVRRNAQQYVDSTLAELRDRIGE